ncbi:hypothetical protein HUT19_26775 [Streptomyces sp. NA02950]|uniref:hypothetical protein n=1 Tax=Streptomyces sp. NA02950 TaxID=2742137 RepID=UPI00159044AC|nr:hypothetical protein [Streptomyces sp. NA02950]QKV94905.1 hypothetical protein HUT19_26775 [Streptomyces sp. NA02950]
MRTIQGDPDRGAVAQDGHIAEIRDELAAQSEPLWLWTALRQEVRVYLKLLSCMNLELD